MGSAIGLSDQLQRKLDRCFEMLKINPRNHPNIKSLKGDLAGYYRYRVGDYRVIYSIDIVLLSEEDKINPDETPTSISAD